MIFALLIIILSGALITRGAIMAISRRPLSTSLSMGSGLPVGILLSTGLLLVITQLNINFSQAAKGALAVMSAGFCGLLIVNMLLKGKQKPSSGIGSSLAWAYHTFTRHPVLYILTVGFLTLHAWFTLENYLVREVFSWDAFTTWVFRAKAWVLSGSFSNFSHTPHWLVHGDNGGYAIYANHYPLFTSLAIAFLSSLTNEWEPMAINAAWGAAYCSIACLTYGVLKVIDLTPIAALMGTLALISMPLVNSHAALVGYADLWIAVTSGIGLSLLLAWSLKKDLNALLLGFLLLAIGSQVKHEGWVWLIVGVIFIGILSLLTRRFFYLSVISTAISAIVVVFAINTTSQGAMTLFDVSSETYNFGEIGIIKLRPYNPLPNYLDAIFFQPNFHLLGSLYLVALAAITILLKKDSLPFWLLSILLIAVQGVIFGLSNYSEFAEIGTAINRILLQVLPVFVTISTFGIFSLTKFALTRCPKLNLAEKLKIIVSGSVLAAIVVGIGFSSSLKANNSNRALVVQAVNMTPIIGATKTSNGKIAFIESSAEVGVLKASSGLTPEQQLPHIIVRFKSTTRFQVDFYWIIESDPQTVHRIAIPHTSDAALSMLDQKSWGEENVIEYGIIVPADHFDSVAISGLEMRAQLGVSDIDLALSQWTTNDGPTQRTLNSVQESKGVFTSLSALLNGSALFLFFCLAAYLKSTNSNWPLTRNISRRISYAPAALLVAVFVSWLISDSRWLLTLNGWAKAPKNPGFAMTAEALASGLHLEKPARGIKNQIAPQKDEMPSIVVIPATPADNFEAQKLPYLLLPLRAIFVTDLSQIDLNNWQGHIVVVGRDRIAREQIVNSIIQKHEDRLELATRGALTVLFTQLKRPLTQ